MSIFYSLLFLIFLSWIFIGIVIGKIKNSNLIGELSKDLIQKIILTVKSFFLVFDSIFKCFLEVYELIGSSLKTFIEILKVITRAFLSLYELIINFIKIFFSLFNLLIGLTNETKIFYKYISINSLKKYIYNLKENNLKFLSFVKSAEDDKRMA